MKKLRFRTETAFKVFVLRELRRAGFWVEKIQQVGKCGTPDLLGCAEGLFFAWELKRMEGKPTALQLFKLKEIEQAGGIAQVVTPETFDLAMQVIRGKALERLLKNQKVERANDKDMRKSA